MLIYADPSLAPLPPLGYYPLINTPMPCLSFIICSGVTNLQAISMPSKPPHFRPDFRPDAPRPKSHNAEASWCQMALRAGIFTQARDAISLHLGRPRNGHRPGLCHSSVNMQSQRRGRIN
ncbi:hypothetical protein E2C01_057303 [Portunus trituberculatus]|uniref:Uncharacterized protein n=1 Tax=Portunus trituberculatus TaxID=210409 RepID=A0A5B7GZY8_PORTR|nr:hypothetical protein [Portunus trituberculatus]